MNWRKAGMPARRLLASPRGRAVMEEQRRGGGALQVVTPPCEERREEGRPFDARQ